MAMRTIETDGLKCLGHDEHGPWRLGDDRLLRASVDKVPLQTEADARAVFDTYHQARIAGAPTPDALEVVRVADGYGVVVEYVAGLPLGIHLMFGSYSIETAGYDMGVLARKLHAVHMGAGRDWGALFTQRAQELSTLMSPELGNRLISLVEKIRLIDMEDAGFGHPTFDLAIARSRLVGAANNLAVSVGVERGVGERVWRRVWRSLLKSYFESAGESTLDDFDQRFEMLAEIEICHQIYANRHDDVGHMSDDQRERLAAGIQRIEELLPHVTRLDF